ncbi:RIC1-domain-containing protein [Radiomyces spectabilis]|uniref:RIC1-domain-containing protein n=1 Tax=Radiomyces spectabilis TaxID=64574 RepID=UPI00221F3B12|nr:RIC1-domain-containing protein [Radiomyces spectabilis]KAI8384220.1 RIC1-domain-containing protein [Radiomyces spectabilis]
MPTTILTFVERSEKHIEEFGENHSLLWKPDASAVAIITTKNYLLVYAVLTFDQPSLEFHFSTAQHASIMGPGEGKGSRSVLLKFRLAVRVDAGIACGTSSDDALIIATKNPPAVQCISWKPHRVNSTQTAIQNTLDIFIKKSEQIQRLIYVKAMNISVWITNEGRAYFVQCANKPGPERRSSKASNDSVSSAAAGKSSPLADGSSTSSAPSMPSFADPIHWSGVCFHGKEDQDLEFGKQATCVAVNPKFSLIAVGTKSGIVYVYSIQNYTSAPSLSHELSIVNEGYTLDPVGNSTSSDECSITSMAWTTDGYALAAGYRHHGLALWTVFGRTLCSMADVDDILGYHKQMNGEYAQRLSRLQDTYVLGVDAMFWAPGNYQLFALAGNHITKQNNYNGSLQENVRFFAIPFVKSALTAFHNSESARRCLLQADDRLLLYNNGGEYQENNTSTIDPDAVTWTHIPYPTMYITEHWPIRYAAISQDGKFIAVAGRRGLTHYSTISSRWKIFGNQQQEQSFLVRGGLAWYKHILIAACEVIGPSNSKAYELRLYSRDNNLDNAHVLHTETLPYMPAYVNICGKYLLVYTTENVVNIYHVMTNDNFVNALTANNPAYHAKLELIRRISFADVVARPARLRSVSLFGNMKGEQIEHIDDVISANILLLVDGKLIMLTPRIPDDDDDSDLIEHSFDQQTQYDLHVLSDNIEYYWIGRKSIANLRTSLWLIDGKGIKLLTNLLRGESDDAFNRMTHDIFESEPSTPTTPGFFAAKSNLGQPYSLGYRINPETSSPNASIIELEGVSRWRIDTLEEANLQALYIPLDSYPHAVLLEKGVIVGIEQSMAYKNALGLMVFKASTKTHLFLHHLFRHLLMRGLEEDAVVFARAYEGLVYFGHALEILLHMVLEEEADQRKRQDAILPLVIKFLDQFPHALDVIVSCARKTEVALWDFLFSVVGKPKDLFELCLGDGRLRTATSYLIILQTMQPTAVGEQDTTRLLQKAMDVNDYELCKELVRFLSSIDNTGKTLQEALKVIQQHMNNDE